MEYHKRNKMMFEGDYISRMTNESVLWKALPGRDVLASINLCDFDWLAYIGKNGLTDVKWRRVSDGYNL